MKIHQYNEMMRWLTRPKEDPSIKQLAARDFYQGGRVQYKPGGLVEPGVMHYAKKGGPKNPGQGFEKGNIWYKQNIGKYNTDIVRLRKLRQTLDNLEKGSTLYVNELHKNTGVSRATINNILAKEYKDKFDIPGMGKAQSLTIQKYNLKKLAKDVKIPTPFPKFNLVKWPNEGIKNKYIADLKTKYTFPSGSAVINPEAAKVSNAALAKKYFGEINQATTAKVERINSILSRDLNLTYPKATRDSSSLRRYGRVIESQKYLSEAEKEILKKQTTQKQILNKYFKNNPKKVFTNKKLKELIDVKLKNGKLDFTPRYDNPKKYEELAKRGSLFDEFDISPIRGEKRNIQYPVNKNISPGKFNQGFIKQVDSYFKNTAGSTTPEVVANKKAIHEFLKSKGYTVEIIGEGRIGAKVLPAIDSATGRLPNIENTLKQLDLPQLVPTSEVISKQKISRSAIRELIQRTGAGIDPVLMTKAVGQETGALLKGAAAKFPKTTAVLKSIFETKTPLGAAFWALEAPLIMLQGTYNRYANERDFKAGLKRAGMPDEAIEQLGEVYGQELADIGQVGLESWAVDQPDTFETRKQITEEMAKGKPHFETRQAGPLMMKDFGAIKTGERKIQDYEEQLKQYEIEKRTREAYEKYQGRRTGGRVPYRNGSILGDARGWERMPDQRDPAMLEAQKQRLAEQVKKANERRFLHRSQYEDTGSFIPEYVQDVAKTTFGTSEGRKYLSSKFGEGVTEGIEWLGMQLPHLIGQTSPVGLIKMQKRMKEGNFSWADLLYQPKLGEKLGMNDYQQKQLEKLRDKALAGGKRGIPKGVETLGTTGELTGAFLDPFAAYGGYKFLKGKTPKIKKTGTEEPVDIGRRDTLKIIGTGGLVAALAKIWPGIFKGSKAKVASKVAKANYVKQFGNVKGMPDFIPSFILKATQSGKLKALPDKDYMSGMVYEVMLPVKRRYYPTTLGHKYPVDKTVKPEIRMEKVPVTVEHVPNTGEMVIHWKGIDNFGNEIDRSMYYKPGETGTQNYAADELGRGTSKEEVVIQDPEFEYTEPDYSSMGPDDTSPDSPSYLDAWDDADEIVEAMEEWVKGVDEKFKKKAAENMRLYNQTDEHFGTATGYQNTAGDWIPDDNNMPFPDTDKSTTDVFKPDWSRKKKASGGSVDYYDNYLPDPDDMDY